MMKKSKILIVLLTFVITFSACGNATTYVPEAGEKNNTNISSEVVESSDVIDEESSEQAGLPEESEESKSVEESSEGTKTEQEEIPTIEGDTIGFAPNLEGITTVEELEPRIEEHLEGLITSLCSDWESFSEEIDTYEKYCENSQTVSDFYQMLVDETEQMCILLCDYSTVYARMVMESDLSNNEKYKAIDGINDCIYEDACDEIHDEIYKGILEEMSDHFYNGIIDDAQDSENYSAWYDVYSNEYSQWYDASSEIYSLYYDTLSEVYSFYYDLKGELYSGDKERAEKVYAKFLQKINKMKGIDSAEVPSSDAIFDTTIKETSSVEELETLVEAHVAECIQALGTQWSELSTEIDTYDKYIEKVDQVEEFHTYIEDSTSRILVMICEYGIVYSEYIMSSDTSSKDKYKDFEDMLDCIYEDACEAVLDEIYDGILEDILDFYYNGIIEEAQDYVKYSDWSDARSDAYKWWSNARSEVYSTWSDTRGDIYSFYSDIRGELFSGDIENANEEIEDFKEKVEKNK